MKRKTVPKKPVRKQSPAPIDLPGKKLTYLTSEGEALAAQNAKTNEALRKAGVILPKYAKHAHEIPDYGFITRGDPKMAKMGASFVGAGGPPPIVWPDMKKLEADLKKPMSEQTKARLSSLPRQKHNNGDLVAVKLADCKSLEDVFKLGAKLLKVKLSDLKKKYAHLNVGQQRMVVGNRLRAMWKNGKIKAEDFA